MFGRLKHPGLRRFFQVLRDFIPACLLLPACSAFALDVGLSGLFKDKAVLVVGGKLRTVEVGSRTPEGVRLVKLEEDGAVVELDGKRQRINLGSHAYSSGQSDGGANEVVLAADSHGQFFAEGSVNGKAVRFLVDTGASQVSMGLADAQRIGLRYQEGARGFSQTANGRAAVWSVKLDRVRIGGVEVTNVDALVHEQNMPMVLLGMSVLNRMEMRRDGSRMTLRRRY